MKIKTIFIVLIIVICSLGIIFTQNKLTAISNNSVDINDIAEVSQILPSTWKYFTFGFDNTIADILLIKIMTSYPLIPLQDNYYGKEAMFREIKKSLEQDLSKAGIEDIVSKYNLNGYELFEPAPTPNHTAHDINTCDDSDCDDPGHNSQIGRLFEKMGFYIGDSPAQHAQLNRPYTENRIQRIKYVFSTLIAIDPQLRFTYQHAFVFFSVMRKRPEITKELILEGLELYPQYSVLYQILASDAITFNSDRELAKEYLKKAIQLNDPEYNAHYVNLLMALYKRENIYYMKAFFLEEMKHTIIDKNVIKQVDAMIKYYMLNSSLSQLNNSISLYKDLFNKYPAGIEDVMQARLLDNISMSYVNMNKLFFRFDSKSNKFYLVPRGGN